LDGGGPEKISFKKFMKILKESGVINEKSGLPSEYWMEPLPMPDIEEETDQTTQPTSVVANDDTPSGQSE